MKKFLNWLIGTVIVDPLIMLFLWNVIVVPMFGLSRIEFRDCLIVSIIINSFYGAYQLGKGI